MRLLRAVALALVAVFVVPAVSHGQSLAEVAAKEKQRRKKLKDEHVKSYSDSDLGHSKARIGAESVSANAGDSSAADAKTSGSTAGVAPAKKKTDDEIRAEKEKDWRDRLQKATEQEAKLNDEIGKIQLSLNDTTQNLYGARRTSLLNRLDAAKKELATTQQNIESLRDEGRRNGFQ